MAIVSCKKDDITEPDESSTYEIKAAESDFYTIKAPAKAEAGQKVEVTVTPVENVFIDGLTFNEEEAENTAENRFAFTMPAENVTLAVQSSATVTVEPSSYFSGYADKETAAVGETVTVTFTANYINDVIAGAKVNGTIDCTLVSADLGEYIFTFEMPEGPANITGHLANEYLLIEREWDDHCVVVMLDCINHQGTEQEFCSQVPGGIVHFIYRWDIGYDVECKVLGKTSGTDYTDQVFWSLAEDNLLYQDCWAFYMPEEDVVIKAVSTEKGVYAGEEFTGDYKAYMVNPGAERVATSEDPTMALELRESAAYIVTSSDENAYDFSGLYNVTDGKIEYDPENCRGDFALSGEILEDGFAFIIVNSLLDNRIDNRKYYFAGKEDFTFACATDTESATRFLIEAERNGDRAWWFVETETRSIKEASASFTSGSSISGSSEAMIEIDGAPYIRYTYQTGSLPVFQYRGKEAGSYSSADNGTLELDGFGTATYNGTSGEYTIEANIVTFTATDGTETLLNINTENHTFEAITPSTELQLYPVYSTQTSWICVDGSVTQTGYAKVAFDSDYSGNEKEGYALIKIWYMEYGMEEEMIGASCPYFIDETNRTVTISNVLQGSGTGWSTTKKDIVLNISDDNTTLTFADPYIFSTSSPNIYCFGGEYTVLVNETPATPEPAEGWDGPKTYSKSGLVAYYELQPYEFGGAITVTMDKDVDGNAKTDYATVKVTVNDIPIVNDCKPYTFDESTSTLTIQGVTQGWMTGATDMDMPFTVSADKQQIKLASDYNYGSIYSATGMFGFTYVTHGGHALIGE